MTRATSAGWSAFVSSLYRVDKPPKGFLTLSEFKRRFGGRTQQLIKDDMISGKIPRRWCIREPWGQKGEFRVRIHWDSVVNQYAMALPAEHRPSGFDPSETFRPINGPEWIPPMPHELEEEEVREADELANLPQVNTLDEARLRVEQLKIMKMQAEIRLANNQTIWVEDMIAAGRQWGVELRAALLASKNRMKSQLAACGSVQGCDKILENGLRDALDPKTQP